MAEDAKKKKRINGTYYWQLLSAVRRIEKAQKEWKQWCQDKAREVGHYPDQVAFRTGMVTLDGKPPSRIDRKIVDEAEKVWAKVEVAAEEADRVHTNIAKVYRTYVDCIDPRTGDIKDADVEEVQPPVEIVPPPEDEADGEDKEAAGEA